MFSSSSASPMESQLQNQLSHLMTMHEQVLRENGEFQRQNQQLLQKNQELMSTIIDQDKRIQGLERMIGAYQDEVRTWQSGVLRVSDRDVPSSSRGCFFQCPSSGHR
mmetsp:Transcript_105150/g.307319  ORF Transcript_105150/g.307319 Transcript_105150/m.307319 type:complete len:107 (-) Transcript_105150:191-511(-)